MGVELLRLLTLLRIESPVLNVTLIRQNTVLKIDD